MQAATKYDLQQAGTTPLTTPLPPAQKAGMLAGPHQCLLALDQVHCEVANQQELWPAVMVFDQ